MNVGSIAFRGALRKFASGITIVTATLDDTYFGMTCTSFASVSLEPPLVLAALENDSHTLAAVRQAGLFAVSVLNNTQQWIARAFATPGPKPFDDIDVKVAGNGAPLIVDAIALLECSLEGITGGGDHDIVVGRVQWCDTNGGSPLLYYDRDYHSLS